jgi:hypothetical protein
LPGRERRQCNFTKEAKMRRLVTAALVAAVGIAAVLVGPGLAASTQVAARCGPGTVKGVAIVVGDPHKGMANLPTSFSGAANLFDYRWNCSGGAITVRQSDRAPGFDIHFAGNPGKVALVTPNTLEAGGGSAIRNADGSFHIAIGGAQSGGSFANRNDLAFTVIVV